MTTQNTIHTTVNELENEWGTGRDEWGLMGPVEMSDDETIRFSRRDDGYVIERHDEREGWYVASDYRFSDDDVSAL